jgi:hypothetical protein
MGKNLSPIREIFLFTTAPRMVLGPTISSTVLQKILSVWVTQPNLNLTDTYYYPGHPLAERFVWFHNHANFRTCGAVKFRT